MELTGLLGIVMLVFQVGWLGYALVRLIYVTQVVRKRRAVVGAAMVREEARSELALAEGDIMKATAHATTSLRLAFRYHRLTSRMGLY